jgi:PrcB C-terminal/Antistasin family
MLPTHVRTNALGVPIFTLSLLAGLGAAGCNPQDFEEILGEVGDTTPTTPAGVAIPFQEFTDDVGARTATETRILIRTPQGYTAVFGHAPPADVDLSRQWVIFYAAGTKPTGGYDANLLSLTRTGGNLLAVTELVSPAGDCAVIQLVTSPYVLVKFDAQVGTAIAFAKKNSVHNCNTPAVRCGGFGNFPCPSASDQCVDDPSDSCDPDHGGADCGGICQCVQKAACAAGTRFDSSLAVCACVADAPKVFCGGIAGIACPGAGKCIDDPSDSCDPRNGGADCGGICTCAPIPCPGTAPFDGSPKVCACVPRPPACGPVCDIFCQYGHALDANGCPLCSCNPAPTK